MVLPKSVASRERYARWRMETARASPRLMATPYIPTLRSEEVCKWPVELRHFIMITTLSLGEGNNIKRSHERSLYLGPYLVASPYQ